MSKKHEKDDKKHKKDKEKEHDKKKLKDLGDKHHKKDAPPSTSTPTYPPPGGYTAYPTTPTYPPPGGYPDPSTTPTYPPPGGYPTPTYPPPGGYASTTYPPPGGYPDPSTTFTSTSYPPPGGYPTPTYPPPGGYPSTTPTYPPPGGYPSTGGSQPTTAPQSTESPSAVSTTLPLTLCLRASHGKYLTFTSSGVLQLTSSSPTPKEVFSTESLSNHSASLKTAKGGYLAARGNQVTIEPRPSANTTWNFHYVVLPKTPDQLPVISLQNAATTGYLSRQEDFVLCCTYADGLPLYPESYWDLVPAQIEIKKKKKKDSSSSSSSSSSDDEKHSLAVPGWNHVSGFKFRQVVARGGAAYGIQKDGEVLKKAGNSWEPIKASFRCISVSNTGSLWGTTPQNEVFKQSGDGSWAKFPGAPLVTISAGNDSDIWGLDSKGYTWRFNGSFFSIVKSIKLKNISVGTDGTCWGISSSTIVRWDNHSSQWVKVFEDDPTHWRCVYVIDGNNIWAVNKQGLAFKLETSTLCWVAHGGNGFVRITADEENVFALKKNGFVYHKAIEKADTGSEIKEAVARLREELERLRKELVEKDLLSAKEREAYQKQLQALEESRKNEVGQFSTKDKVIDAQSRELKERDLLIESLERALREKAEAEARLREEIAKGDQNFQEQIIAQQKQALEKELYFTWEVTIVTGDLRGAGTEAAVDIVLYGETDRSDPLRLDNSPYNFRRGRVDTFKVVVPKELGKLQKITIGHDNSGIDPSWFLERVTVVQSTGHTYKFQAARWLSLEKDTLSVDLLPVEDFNLPKIKNYDVSVWTGDRLGAGTEATVTLLVVGEHGKQEIVLDTPRQGFVRNSKNLFGFDSLDLGALKSITIGHDNSGFSPAWFLEKVVIHDKTEGKNWFFFCGKWLWDKDATLSVSIDASEVDGGIVLPMVDYNVQVLTGDRRGAGTDANVFITIYGELGNSTEKILDSAADNFERAKTDNFVIRCPSLGELTKIRIGHDNTGFGPAWFLDKVIVNAVGGNQSWYFPCGGWIESQTDLVKEIPATSSDGTTYLPLVSYKVTVVTGDVRGAGTDANVSITVYGKNGDSGSRNLDSPGNNFESGKTDVFGFDAVDLGEITKIRIGHDNSGFGPGWFLSHVVVRNEKTGVDTFFFVERWLAKDENDGETNVEVPANNKDQVVHHPQVTYNLAVVTGDRRGAGTDANVYAILWGNKGNSGKRKLSNHQNNFERGRTDIFSFSCLDLGDIEKLTIGHDNTGAAPGWFLGKVELKSGDGHGWVFGANRWLAADEGDGQIQIDLAPLPSSEFHLKPSSVYRVEVFTGDRHGAGTNANVHLTLFGEHGKSRTYPLDNSQDNFERKKKDVFNVESDELGELTKIRIGHDNSGLFASWFLDKVVIYSESLKKNFYFLHGKWLDNEHGIVAEIAASTEDGVSSLPLLKYNVKIHTGDRRYAGTDANVFINLFGANGDTGDRNLEKKFKNCFERNAWDEFEIEAVDLGQLQKIRIGHDGVGIGAGWFLDKVVIQAAHSEAKHYFLCGKWFDAKEGDGLVVREIPVSAEDGEPSAPVTKYILTVFTGDRRGAGTDANVVVNVIGELGESGDITLSKKGNLFERNAVDEFVFEAVTLGELKKIRIGHDNSGLAPGWFLDKVIVKSQLGSEQFYFLCGKWFAKDEDDGLIVREIDASKEDGKSYLPLNTYDIEVITGDRHGAGTDANVSIVIHGEHGDSGVVPLENKLGQFKRKSSANFSVSTAHLGLLTKIRIGHDGTGIGSGWFLDKVIITDKQTNTKYYFHHGKWLAVDEDDGAIVREIPASSENATTYAPLSKYIISVFTGDRHGAGTDANVSIKLLGEHGSVGEIILDNAQNNFERKKVDVFAIEAVEIGHIKQIQIGHDNSGFGAAWFLDKVIVKSESLSKDFYFLCGRWFATDLDDHLIVRTLDASDVDGVPSLPLVTYQIDVTTANVRGSGTDANVSITLFGEYGESGPHLLDNANDNFERGKTDKFAVECVDLGALKKIRIGHDGTGIGPGWLLEKVIITDKKRNSVSYFLSGQWFDAKEGDGALERDIAASTEDGAVSIPRRDYKITVVTGDRDGAGTDAKVFVVLFGENGSTPQLTLDKSGNPFERNATDEFTINSIDIGALKKLRIGHDGSKPGAGWFLEKVIVTPLPKEGEEPLPETFFLCGRWLATDEDDGQIIRELPPSNADGQASLPWVHYKVKVYTGERRGAGTDANVFMVLTGVNGDSGRRNLEKKGNCFERGQVDEFEFEFVDLGPLSKISIGHDNSGVGPGWFLDKVIVEVGDGTTFFFPFGRWLATDEEDGKIVRETPAATEDSQTYLPEVNYVVKVKTGDRWGAGTDANVYIQIFGDKGKSDKKLLDNAQNNFERAKEDVFAVRAVDLGTLTKISIGHDNSGFSAGWFLENISIHSEKENKTYHFFCGNWLATDEGDGLIEREIAASDEHGKTCLPLVTYRLSILTGDRFGAGTDANVKVTLYGTNGDSGERIVDPKGNSFERAKTDIVGIQAVDLGKLTKLRIGHDNSGVGPAWFLDKVIVENEANKEKTFFLCGKWLATDEEDSLIVRELPASDVDGVACLPMKDYDISVVTGDRWGAGTDANVYICIFGTKGDSGKHFLSNKRNNFERNQTDVFRLHLVDLGEITRIKIGHDGSRPGAGWFLDKVIITPGDGAPVYYFGAGRWLAVDENDKKIEIDIAPSLQDAQTYSPSINYTITVVTGDIRGAGTDANVFVDLIGANGESGPKKLENGLDNFERAKTDIFVFRCPHLGDLQKIRIGHDNSGFAAGWFLDKVIVNDAKTNKDYFFLVGKWFAKDEDDGAIMREIVPADSDGKTYEPYVTYEVSVVTGDRMYSGTDAQIFITIFGEKGNTGKRILDNPKKHPAFERGQTDVFGVSTTYLGDLKKILIGHDNSGVGPGWFLDKVIIKDPQTNQQVFFLCGKWFADDEDDKQIVREIPSQKEDGSACDPLVHYNVVVMTGDRRGAGTDATVSIFIEGEKGNSGDRILDASFTRSSVHKFAIPCVDLGPIKQIRIGHDNRGVGPGWFLDRVIVRDTLRSAEHFFVAGRWLAQDEDDGKTSINILPSKPSDVLPTPALTTYRVSIFTGDVRGAGTDALVFLELFGDKGKTGEKKLDAGREAFEKGKKDEFGIEVEDLGNLQRLRIGHDGSGFGPGWFLDKVVVRNEASGQQWFFLSGQWFDSTQGDGKIVRDIIASTSDGVTYSPLTKYLLEVRTADRKGAGTKSNVFVTLYGSTTDSGEQALEGPDSFKSGGIDHFEISTSDLGALSKINVRHDNSGWGANASWFVDKFIVTNQSTGQRWFFLIGKHLSLKTGEKKISCQVPASKEDGTTVLPLSLYKFTFLTGDTRGAGTNANVFIQVFGKNGDSGVLQLEGEENSFERGQRSTFGYQLVDLGDIQKIKVGHDNSGFFPGWFLVNVLVRNEKTGQEYNFPSDQWFDKDKGDGQIARELYPAPNSGQVSTAVGYEVLIVTANRHGAGTEANVFLQVFGTSGETERMALGKGKFDRGQTHKHDFQIKDLGALTKIRMGHDNSGIGPGWMVDKVTVKNLRTEDVYEFPVFQWFDKGEADGKIVRDIEVSSKDQ